MGKKVAASQLGIVFHTRYVGASLPEMSASFGVDVSGLQGVGSVAVFSAQFDNVNGKANLSNTELIKINNSIRVAKQNLLTGKNFLNVVGGGKKSFDYAAVFKIYFNDVIRRGTIPSSSQAMTTGFIKFLSSRYDKEIDKKKTEKSKTLQVKLNNLRSGAGLHLIPLEEVYKDIG